MKGRESQALQILVIVLVMLVVVLGATTFVFYSKSEAQRKTAEQLRQRAEEAEQGLQSATNAFQLMQFMISGGASGGMEQLAQALDQQPLPTDPQLGQAVQQLRDQYVKDMQLLGDAYEQNRNYQALARYLFNVVIQKNEQLAAEKSRGDQLVQDKRVVEQRETQRAQVAENARDQAQNDLTREREEFNRQRQRIEQEKNQLAAQLQQKNEEYVKLVSTFQERESQYKKQIEQLEKQVDGLKLIHEARVADSFERPDGQVTGVNHRLRLVYINLGSADGLRKQTTFSVYDKRTSGVMTPTAMRKGSIEVMEILGEHEAVCKLLEDNLENIIVPGDLIHTPMWAPGQRLKFVVIGFIDMNGDGVDDSQALEHLIKLSGGEVVTEVTPQTRYVIVGEARSREPGRPEMTPEEAAQYKDVQQVAIQLGVDQIDYQKFLTFAGWRGDLRVLGVGIGEDVPYRPAPSAARGGASTGSTHFRRRLPGGSR